VRERERERHTHTHTQTRSNNRERNYENVQYDRCKCRSLLFFITLAKNHVLGTYNTNRVQEFDFLARYRFSLANIGRCFHGNKREHLKKMILYHISNNVFIILTFIQFGLLECKVSVCVCLCVCIFVRRKMRVKKMPCETTKKHHSQKKKR